MTLHVLWEEIGLSVNTFPHFFTMCHLHNALKRICGGLKGTWETIQKLPGRFIRDLFMGEQPENIKSMRSRNSC